MNTLLRCAALLAIFALLPLTTFSQENNRLPKSSPASALSVTDLQGKPMEPLRRGDRKAAVFLFVVRDCPISNVYAPEINQIVADYAAKKVAFFLVYVEPDASLAELREHYRDFGFRCPALWDKSHQLVKKWNAQHTPEAVLIDSSGKVIYQGRIDDRYIDYGKGRHQPSRQDLRYALDAVVEGREIAVAATPVIGCPIPEIAAK